MYTVFIGEFAENQGDATVNNDMPWVNLTQEEVDDLRKKKYELTEYGKEKLRQLMKDNGSETEH